MLILRCMKEQVHLGGARSPVVYISRVFVKQLFLKYLLCGRNCSRCWVMGVTKVDAFLSRLLSGSLCCRNQVRRPGSTQWGKSTSILGLRDEILYHQRKWNKTISDDGSPGTGRRVLTPCAPEAR